LRSQDGEVAGRIAEPAFVLLERGVVFLVDDDHAEIGDWREHRRTRPQHDARFARNALPPGGEAFGIGERGMKHRDRNGETFAKAADELRREPDLRDQDQRAPVATQGALHRVQIDFGLAAAGDAIQKEGREASLRSVNGLHGHRLDIAQGGPVPRSSSVPGSCDDDSGASEEEANPRSTSARIGVRQSANCSASASADIPSVLRSASSSSRWRGARFNESSPAIPASVANHRSVSARAGEPSASESRQGCGDHRAERVVVVLGGPLEQLHHLRVDHRIRVDDLEQRFEFFLWQI
jgi:hypothetical protein